MSYLVDTNVISELARPQPEARVLKWFQTIPDDALHLSVLTLGELRKGVEMAKEKSRKEKLRIWLEQEVKEWFGNRLLPITEPIAEQWGRLTAQIGRPIPAIDSLLAATAIHHGLRIVTRNISDFNFPGLDVVNPWEAERD